LRLAKKPRHQSLIPGTPQSTPPPNFPGADMSTHPANPWLTGPNRWRPPTSATGYIDAIRV
jgi:hypothetical protein